LSAAKELPAMEKKTFVCFFARATRHDFWADDVSLLNGERVNATRLLDSAQVTDSYLLALARSHGGQLATFDRRFVPDAVINASQALHLIR
jgi:uncharacterized protein